MLYQYRRLIALVAGIVLLGCLTVLTVRQLGDEPAATAQPIRTAAKSGHEPATTSDEEVPAISGPGNCMAALKLLRNDTAYREIAYRLWSKYPTLKSVVKNADDALIYLELQVATGGCKRGLLPKGTVLDNSGKTQNGYGIYPDNRLNRDRHEWHDEKGNSLFLESCKNPVYRPPKPIVITDDCEAFNACGKHNDDPLHGTDKDRGNTGNKPTDGGGDITDDEDEGDPDVGDDGGDDPCGLDPESCNPTPEPEPEPEPSSSSSPEPEPSSSAEPSPSPEPSGDPGEPG